MIVKLIHCTPHVGQAECFSKAQQGWQPIAGCDGFLGQSGGWQQTSADALILALWDQQHHIDEFMDTVHDPVAAAIRQDRTYQHCEVGYFTVLDSAAVVSPSALTHAGFVSLRVMTGSPESAATLNESFREQSTLAVAGYMGRYLCRSNHVDDRYLLISMWQHPRDFQQHHHLNNHDLSRFSTVDPYQVTMEPAWNVIPEGIGEPERITLTE